MTASNGVEAIAAFNRDSTLQPVSVDWEMPVLDGLKVVPQIKSTGRLVYAIMLTGRTRDEDLERAFAAGADDYVSKPSRPAELRNRVMSGQRLLEVQLQLAQAHKLAAVG